MPQFDDDSLAGPQRRLLLIVALLIIANAIVQLFVGDFDSLSLIYADLIQATVDWDQAKASGVLSSYHARRFLVPWFLHYALRATLDEITVTEAIVAHQLFGLACSLAMAWIWHRIALREKLSLAAFAVGAGLLLANSNVAKTAYYFPAEPYPLKLALGLALLWAYLAGSQWGAFLTALVGLFVFDVFFVFASLMVVFPRSQAGIAVGAGDGRRLALLFAAAFAGTAIFLRQALDLDPDYPPTYHGPRWFVPISISLSTLYYFYLVRCLPAQWGLPSPGQLLRAISPLGIVMVLGASALGSWIAGRLNTTNLEVIYPSDNWLPPPFNFMQPGPATHLTFWLGRNGFIPRSISLPLVSYGSAIVNWSAAFPAAILLWPRLAAAARSYGWGVGLQLLLGVLMMFDSEGRHQVLQMPLLTFLAVVVIDRAQLSYGRMALLIGCAVVGSGVWLTFGESVEELVKAGWRADFMNWGFGASTNWRNFWRGLPVFAAFTWLVWLAVGQVYRRRDENVRPMPAWPRDALLVWGGTFALSLAMFWAMTPERLWRLQNRIYETRYVRTVARLLAIDGEPWHNNPPGPDYFCDSPGSRPGKAATYVRVARRPGVQNQVSSPAMSFDQASAYRVLLTVRARFPRSILATVAPSNARDARSDLRRIDLTPQWTPVELRLRPTFQGPGRMQFHLGEGEVEFEYEDLRCEPIAATAWTLGASQFDAAALLDVTGGTLSRLEYRQMQNPGAAGVRLSAELPTVEPGRRRLVLRLRAAGPCAATLALAATDRPNHWLLPPADVRLNGDWMNYTLEVDVPSGPPPRLTLVPLGAPVPLELELPRWESVE